MKTPLYVLFALTVLLAGCAGHPVNTYAEYLKWMNQPENGLVKFRYVNGLEIKVKYMPAEYLAFKELQSEIHYSNHQRDSLIGSYAHSLCFVLTIGPDERKGEGEDIMFRSVTSYEEYKKRVYDMNFFMEETVQLKAGEAAYRPVLSQMENTYEASTKKNIVLVFTPAEKNDSNFTNADVLEFKYSDEQFGLGANYFLFNRKDLNQVPEIKFWSTKG